jgi:hypothetical protein
MSGKLLAKALLGLAVVAGGASAARAQGFGSGEIDRALRPGAFVPHDGASFAHRYQFGTGPILYFNADARRLWYLDYLDREDRAERFGYRPPPPPAIALPPSAFRVRVGVGVGVWRSR